MTKRLLITALAISVSTVLFAGPTPTNKKKITPQGLYVTPQEAHDMKTKEGDKVLFIDVRTPEELVFVGHPDVVDYDIPLKRVDYTKIVEKKKGDKVKIKFAGHKNDKFVEQVEAAVKEKGLDKNAKIIVMCRSGHRSAAAAKLLDKAGYKNVYTLDQGFEGDKDKQKHRTVNGWKNAGLPYNYKVSKDIFKFVVGQ